jgi:hypothetical protein
LEHLPDAIYDMSVKVPDFLAKMGRTAAPQLQIAEISAMNDKGAW